MSAKNIFDIIFNRNLIEINTQLNSVIKEKNEIKKESGKLKKLRRKNNILKENFKNHIENNIENTQYGFNLLGKILSNQDSLIKHYDHLRLLNAKNDEKVSKIVLLQSETLKLKKVLDFPSQGNKNTNNKKRSRDDIKNEIIHINQGNNKKTKKI